jgi:hypothetical protein
MPKRPSNPPPPSPESPDAFLRDVKRMLSREKFESIDEVNAFLQQMVGKPIGAVEPANDRERAEDLVESARLERSDAKRRKLISDALALDADCVPAHLVLAEDADSPASALTHLDNAISAGERVLAPLLAENESVLWADPVGRVWLIARSQRSELYWQMGDRPRAIEEVRGVLRSNPGDNAGMRYVLLQWLMRAGSLADIDQLLGEYDEPTAAWLFSMTLHRYRVEGPSEAATRALRTAVAENRFVVPMLTGKQRMPDELPDSYTHGGADEAALYVESAVMTWLDAMGAMEWAEANAGPVSPRRARRR